MFFHSWKTDDPVDQHPTAFMDRIAPLAAVLVLVFSVHIDDVHPDDFLGVSSGLSDCGYVSVPRHNEETLCPVTHLAKSRDLEFRPRLSLDNYLSC